MYDKENLGRNNTFQYCPICHRPDMCFITKGIYYNIKQCDGADNTAVIVWCARSHNYEKMQTSGTTFSNLDDTEGDMNLATSFDGSQWVFIAEQKDAENAGYTWCAFLNYEAYCRKEEYWAQRFPRKGKNARKKGGYSSPIPLQKKEEPEKIAGDARLDEVYTAFLELLTLESWTVKALKTDGWNDEMISYMKENYLIRSLPPEDYERFNKGSDRKDDFEKRYRKSPTRKAIMEELIKKVGEPEMVPGFEYRIIEKDGSSQKKWIFRGAEGYVLPVFDPNGYIVRLRVRLSDETLTYEAGKLLDEMAEKEYDVISRDEEKLTQLMERTGGSIDDAYQEIRTGIIIRDYDGDEKTALSALKKKVGKYKWLSSNKEKGGASSRTVPGFYGLEWMGNYVSGVEKRVIITEGEKKGMVASYFLGYLLITLPGVGQYRMFKNWIIPSVQMNTFDWLRSIGVTTIAVANDTDMLQNAEVFKATKGLCKEIINEGFVCEMTTWGETGGKGIDDACLNGETLDFTEIYMD